MEDPFQPFSNDKDDDDDELRMISSLPQATDNAPLNLVPRLVAQAVLLYATPLYNKTPYHTSALSGYAWVQELIHGHPK
ncbi:hypothetical protein K439DRAFT_1397684 [Ramaria rubella]|nr:hypothetical protein K439DRAFT_1397684 [Ramaria rubella]